MPMIKIVSRLLAAGACSMEFEATPAVAAASGASAPVTLAVLLPDAAMDGLNGPQRNLSSYHGRPSPR